MSSGESRVSRTSPRRPGVRLVLLDLCCGNAILFTPLCRVCGEEAHYRLDQPGDSVFIGFCVDPETTFAGGVGRDRAYARYPRVIQEPRRLIGAERPDEVLHGGAGREGNAVYLALLQTHGHLLFAFRQRDRLVGRRYDDLGACLAELLRQDLTRHLRPRDEDAFSCKSSNVKGSNEGLGPVLLGDY